MAKVSIIVPMYNCSNTLKRCIDSISNQTYKDIELLLVDDGSTDSTKEIAYGYIKKDDRIKYIYKSNGGVSSARNVGIKNATGDYITFVDPDDMLLKEAIYDMVEILESSNCDFVKCNYYLSNDENLKISEGKCLFNEDILVDNKSKKKEILMKIIKGEISTFVWVLMIKRKFIDNVKPFNENVDYMEDKLFFIDIFSKSENYYLSNKCTYYYFFKDFNTRDIKFWSKYLNNINIVFEQIQVILDNNNESNNEIENLIKVLGVSQLNEIIYKMFCIDNDLDIEKIWNSCNKKLFNNLIISKDISRFSRYCLKLLNSKKYKKLKKAYKLKKMLKQRCK